MSTHQQQADPLTSFWRDWFAQMQAQAAGAQAHAQQAAAHAPPQWPMTPDAVKRMQSAYLDALARYADQYMRSPQFLDAMKKSLDQALEFRKQVDKMLKDGATGSFASGGGAEILAAVRQSEMRLNERLDDLSDRIARLEGGRRSSSRAGATPKKKSKKKASRRSAKAG